MEYSEHRRRNISCKLGWEMQKGLARHSYEKKVDVAYLTMCRDKGKDWKQALR